MVIMKKSSAEKRVKALGWRDGTVAEFLNLTPEESALIEIKLALEPETARAAEAMSSWQKVPASNSR